MNDALLQVNKLATVLDTAKTQVRAVDGISFDIRRHETFALLGESGCGKSMTALSIMRLLPEAGRIMAGSVMLDGEDLLMLPETAMRTVRGKRIAMIFQEPMTSLNPVLTIGRQIAETLERHTDLQGEAVRRRVVELLDEVGIPDAARRCGDYPFQLSGGMKQRVMIAIALACEPELLIADEPTTALDVTIQAQVLELLRNLQRKRGMAILLITHDLGVVAEMANRVAVMYAGEIVELADRADFFAAPRHPYTQKLFASLPGSNKRGQQLEVIEGAVPRLDQVFTGCRFAERCDRVFAPCRDNVPEWRELGDGRGVRCHLAQSIEPGLIAHVGCADEGSASLAIDALPSSAHPTSPLLEVSALKIHFPIRKGLFQRTVGQVKAVDGVSLDIRAGRTLALVGESGCGKTTVGKGILQLLRPTAGSVRYAGSELTALTTTQLRRYRADLQVIFQDPYASLDPRMRVGDILEEGMIALRVGNSEGERLMRMDELLQQVGLAPEAKYRYPHEFSGGQRQRIAIARALAVNPKLIVCDEPTSALDVSVQAQILNLLKELQDRLGLAYLFITHNLAVVEYFAHDVAVMYLGRIVEYGSSAAVLGNPRHPYTQALLSAAPAIDPASKREIIRLSGDLPSPANPPKGCHFHPRCPHAMPLCRESYPESTRIGAAQTVLCYLYSDL
jgi:peptide/nickel transport system ATP-binding protein